VLVAAVRAAGHRALPLPGASSALAALSVSGDVAAGGFRFVGFLPPKAGERTAALQGVAGAAEAQVLFEAPHRIDSLLKALAEACPERSVTVCRELTKQFETVHTASARHLPGWLAEDANRARGEFVLVLHALEPSSAADDADSAHDPMLRTLLAELPLKQAVGLAASLSGAPRNALYARALALKSEAKD
jgi:16S rRNA (cytidine1402-2'-O)-methyltransferase